jgi:succinate--hydroxymethylglutarate CoA-transferase
MYRAPPYLGQHTEEILGELGYDMGEVKQFRKDGIV